tara:strand:+ start:81 stop:194 length:114 start_codon:yes stop_codon:yes gene_type:complete
MKNVTNYLRSKSLRYSRFIALATSEESSPPNIALVDA